MPKYNRQPQCITQTNYLTSGDNPAPTAHDWRPWNVRLYSGLLCNHWCKNYTNKLQPCCQKQIKSIHGKDETLASCNCHELIWRSSNYPLQVLNTYCALVYASLYESVNSSRELTKKCVSHNMRLWQRPLLSHRGHIVWTCSPGHRWSNTHLNSENIFLRQTCTSMKNWSKWLFIFTLL